MVSSDTAKSGTCIDGYDFQNKDKTNKFYHCEKIRVRCFFSAVYHNKKHVIPYPVIVAIFSSNILQR